MILLGLHKTTCLKLIEIKNNGGRYGVINKKIIRWVYKSGGS